MTAVVDQAWLDYYVVQPRPIHAERQILWLWEIGQRASAKATLYSLTPDDWDAMSQEGLPQIGGANPSLKAFPGL